MSKLGITILLAYATLKWKVRRATSSFKTTLINEGLPEEIAHSLAESYHESNKKLLSMIDSGLSAASKSITSHDEEA